MVAEKNISYLFILLKNFMDFIFHRIGNLIACKASCYRESYHSNLESKFMIFRISDGCPPLLCSTKGDEIG